MDGREGDVEMEYPALPYNDPQDDGRNIPPFRPRVKKTKGPRRGCEGIMCTAHTHSYVSEITHTKTDVGVSLPQVAVVFLASSYGELLGDLLPYVSYSFLPSLPRLPPFPFSSRIARLQPLRLSSRPALALRWCEIMMES